MEDFADSLFEDFDEEVSCATDKQEMVHDIMKTKRDVVLDLIQSYLAITDPILQHAMIQRFLSEHVHPIGMFVLYKDHFHEGKQGYLVRIVYINENMMTDFWDEDRHRAFSLAFLRGILVYPYNFINMLSYKLK